MATFITSKTVGESININAKTSTGFWKYNHDGSDSSVYNQQDGWQSSTVTNINGEFTIIPCDSDGNVSGYIILLNLESNQLTSFDGTGLSSLTTLYLKNNQLTSFNGTGLSGLTILNLMNNQLTSFDGTDLSSLTSLNLRNNPLTTFIGGDMGLITGLTFNQDGLINNSWNITTLTSFDGTGLSGLTYLELYANQLTSFSGTGLSSLTELILSNNQLTSFDGTGLSSLADLSLGNNQLTSFDATGLSSLTSLGLSGNPLTPSVNNQILNQLNQNELSDGWFDSSNGRTSVSDIDYDNLISLGWSFEGLDLIIPTTFITSKTVGESINIYADTSTGFWKYNHDGSDSSVYNQQDGYQTITVANANGEFTIMSCNSLGHVIGDITQLNLDNNQLTSFDGTGLTNITYLDLNNNQLTTFDGTVLPSLTTLYLPNNQLTSFDGTNLYSLINLDLTNNPITSFIGGDMGQITYLYFVTWNITTLTSFDSTGLSSLTGLELSNNQLTSFDGTGLSSLTYLVLQNNQLTSFDGTGLSSLTNLGIENNQLTSFDGTGLSSLTSLYLYDNQLTSFDGTGLSSLTELDLSDNQLTSFDGTGLSGLTYLVLNGNPLTPSVNNQILNQLNQNGLSSGEFISSNGRTSASDTDYDNLLNNLGWYFEGLDLIIPPTFITSKAVGQYVSILPITSTGFWKYNHDGSDSNVFSNEDGAEPIMVENVNGEFTPFSCLSDGTISGDITELYLGGDNQITSFDGTGLSSLTYLDLNINPLTTFIGGDMGLITSLNFPSWNITTLTSFDGTGLSSLTDLNLNLNQLTSFDGTGLSSLTTLQLGENQLTSFDGTGLTSLTYLGLNQNQLTSFDGTGLVSLNDLRLPGNLLTSLDVSPLVNLSNLTLFQETKEGIVLTNPITPSSNNQILNQLNQNGLSGGEFYSSNGRTSASNADYDNLLNNLGWYFEGLDLIAVGNRRCRYRTH